VDCYAGFGHPGALAAFRQPGVGNRCPLVPLSGGGQAQVGRLGAAQGAMNARRGCFPSRFPGAGGVEGKPYYFRVVEAYENTPNKPRIIPNTDIVCARKFIGKVEGMTWVTIRNGRMTPKSNKKPPRKISRIGDTLFLLVKPASDLMVGFDNKFGRSIHVA